MTSRPAAAAAPSPMTVSSMVRPLAVVIVDMGLLVVETRAKRKNAFRRRTGRAGVEAQRERQCTRKSRDWPQVSAVIARTSRATLQRFHTPFGAVGSFTLSKHPCSILSLYEDCS